MKRKFALIIFILVSLFINPILVINHSLASTFTENFSTTTRKDSANTTADWNTASGKLSLPQLGWTKADGSTPGYDNVSNTTDNSEAPKIVLDSNGRPNIVWYDSTPGNYEVFFSKWNGSAWTKADGTPGYDNVSNNSGNSYVQGIVLDSNGNPNIIWSDYTPGNQEILFSRWNGSAWTKADGTPDYENISNTAGGSYTPWIVLDSNQRPNILWDDSTPGNRDIFFSKWTSPNWTRADGTPGYDNISNTGLDSYSKKILLDSSGRPNIVWYDSTFGTKDILFSRWNGNAWTQANGTVAGYNNISNNAGTSWYPQMFLDSSDKPNIVWYDNTITTGNYEIFFSKWTSPNWTGADGSTLGYDNISNNVGSSEEPNIVLDSNSRPSILWEDNTPGNDDIFFSRWNGTQWTGANGVTPGNDNISNSSVGAYDAQIVLDSSQRANIVWDDYTTGNGDIIFSRWNGTAWTKADGVTPGTDNISNNSGWSMNPKIALDSMQRPNIVWYDKTPDPPGKYEIFFSKWSGYGTLRQAQSLKINTGTNIIYKVTLTATANINGQTINYYLSANGGTNWEQVTPNAEHTFTNKGNDLRWKAILSTTDPFLNPAIDSLSINYSLQKSIKRLSGDTRYETAIEISKEGWGGGANTVILTRGDLFPDALSGAPLAAKYNAPILLTWPSELRPAVAQEIKRLEAKEVVMLGSEDALYPKVAEQLTSVCGIPQNKITRLGGPTRYETSSTIAAELFPLSLKTGFVATGEDFPDALASASIAAYRKIPIFLVRGDLGEVPGATREALKASACTQTLIAGQTDVVPSSIENWLKDTGYNPTRLGGATRYDTCKLITDYGIANLGLGLITQTVAFGENFPDALTLGPFAGKNQAPILLTRTTFIPESIKGFINTHKAEIFQVYIAGGTDVVSQDVENQILNLIK